MPERFKVFCTMQGAIQVLCLFKSAEVSLIYRLHVAVADIILRFHQLCVSMVGCRDHRGIRSDVIDIVPDRNDSQHADSEPDSISCRYQLPVASRLCRSVT